MKTIALVLIGSSLMAWTAAAHHSDAGLDMQTTVTLEGSVKEFFWRNPHVYFTIETIGANGAPMDWSIQMGSMISLSRAGWTRDSLAPGDRIAVSAHAAIGGRPYGLATAVKKEGAVELGGDFREPEVTVGAPTLEGKWMSKFSEVPRYEGGIDGFYLAHFQLTDKAARARADFDPLSAENPEAQCIGRPSPSMIVSSTRYPIQIQFNDDQQTITIRSQYWDEVRTVYMDGREHPSLDQRTPSGHSIGWWEGDTLVVDTRDFADHRSPYQIGVPSGAQKHVVERYRLLESGTRIAVEFMLEDPEYFVAPMTHSRELIHVPEIDMVPFNCDPEATRRFMTLGN